MFLPFSGFINFLLLYLAYLLHFRNVDVGHFECEERLQPLASRVVLFIVGRLEADRLYSMAAKTSRALLFRRKIETEGSWGVSYGDHLSIPEYCNTAIFSGTRFETSLIWTQAKLAPYHLDSVFDKADDVFLFGDPLFPEFINATEKNWYVKTWKKSFKKKAISSQNFKSLDSFVFDELDTLFADRTMKTRLTKNNTIFVFYLSALANCRQWSHSLDLCIDLISNLQNEILNAELLFHSFYNDSRTSFIFTSNHGLNMYWRKGGLEDTEGTILSWGAGIKKSNNEYKFRRNWRRVNISRVDIEDVDIAPLISTLLGHAPPDYSIGIIPYKMLDIDKTVLFNAFRCNEKQIKEIVLKYKIFTGLNNYPHRAYSSFGNLTARQYLLNNTVDQEKIYDAESIVFRHREHLRFYKYYFKTLIWCVMFLTYMLYGFWLLLRIVSLATNRQVENSFIARLRAYFGTWQDNLLHCSLLIFGVGFSVLFYFKNIPVFITITTLTNVFMMWRVVMCFIDILKGPVNSIVEKMSCCAISVLSIILLVLAIYFALGRLCLVVALTSVTIFNSKGRAENLLRLLWIATSMFLAGCLNLPILEGEILQMRTNCAAAWILMMLFYMYYFRNILDCCFAFLEACLVLLATWNIYNIQNMNEDIPYFCKMLISRIILFAPFMAVLQSTEGVKKLCALGFGLSSSFILLTHQEEPIGLLALFVFLITFYCMELRGSEIPILNGEKTTRDPFGKHDVRRATILLIIAWFGLFATGNGAYQPFLEQPWLSNFTEVKIGPIVAFLIAYRILTPILLSCSTFDLLYKKLNADVDAMLEWYLFLNNVLSLYFFICLKSDGYSLPDIISSITHFVLSHIMPIAVMLSLRFVQIFNSVGVNVE